MIPTSNYFAVSLSCQADRAHFDGFPCAYPAKSRRVNDPLFYFFHDQPGVSFRIGVHVAAKVNNRHVADYFIQGVAVADLLEQTTQAFKG